MTPAQLLAATAADMRKVADTAHGDNWSRDEQLCVVHADGGFICQTSVNDLDHIAAWDPDMARAIADWLDAKAVRYADRAWAMRLLNDIAAGSSPPMLRVCDAWWKSRGIDPQVKEQQ